MKRLIIFLWVLILLLGAAGDGFIGNYKSVAPDYLLTSVAANHGAGGPEGTAPYPRFAQASPEWPDLQPTPFSGHAAP
jgi:hypothetical protein